MADRNKISIGGDVTGNVVAGNQNTAGDVVLGAKLTTDRADLVAQLAALRERLEALRDSIPKYDAVIENLDDLSAEAAKPEAEAEPPVARRLWQKLRSLLTGAGELAKGTVDL